MPKENNSVAPEITLEIDDFGNSQVQTGAMAIAYRLQNLLLTEPYTYPDNPDLGVGIQLFEHEHMTDDTLQSIRSKIGEQVRKYMPDAPIIEVYVEKMVTHVSADMSTVIVGFQLGQEIDNATFIGILLQRDKSTAKVKTDVLIS